MGNSPLTLKKSLLVIAGIAVIAFAIHIFLSWQREARRAERIRLEMVPDQFEVKKILYANSGCTGIGLSGGDDCSGVIMYKLPEKSAQEIIKNGIKFFQALSQKICY